MKDERQGKFLGCPEGKIRRTKWMSQGEVAQERKIRNKMNDGAINPGRK